ncbi:MAG: nucleotidyltransferase domain-containing protein [Pyrobaculum sp.]
MPRLVVEMDRWIKVAKQRQGELLERLRKFLGDVCGEGDVVLFGSRARGTHHALSDWDIAVLTQSGRYHIAVEEFGQVVYIPLASIDEVLAESMIALDIASDGQLLCGRGDHWQIYLKKAAQYIREKRLVKTPSGWYPPPPHSDQTR